MHDGESKLSRGGNKGLREKLEGTRAKEERKRLREEIKVQIVLRRKIRCMTEGK